MWKFFFSCFRLIIILIVLFLICLSAVIYIYNKDLPSFNNLKNYYPSATTRVYSSDGKLMKEFSKENRIFIPVENIPQKLINAFISSEDKNFYHHLGIDLLGLLRAVINNISNLLRGIRALEGGSTITQQVVKTFLLSSEKSMHRKIKEAILAYKISRVLNKDQILELYLNQIYLGNRAYGVGVAALRYFNKSLDELTVNECALLASLPKAPSKFNPFKNYQRAFQRKNYVLNRMYQDDFINIDSLNSALKEKINLQRYHPEDKLQSDYYVSKLYDELRTLYTEEEIYAAGLTVISTLDSAMQKEVSETFHKQINLNDKKKGYRGPISKIDDKNNYLKHLQFVKNPLDSKKYFLSVIYDIDENSLYVKTKDNNQGIIRKKDIKWALNGRRTSNVFRIGDVILTTIIRDNIFSLEQVPLINGGMVVMEPFTGRVLALEGGYDYKLSNFNRVTQAYRQVGSLIKTFVYLGALESDIAPNDIFSDNPIQFYNKYTKQTWEPKNWDNKFLGPVTLRVGLEKSRNMVTLRLVSILGIKKVCEIIKSFGIHDNPSQFLSVVLGSVESTLEKMTNAYNIIASEGIKVTPQYIELVKNRKGEVIYRRNVGDDIAIEEDEECKKEFISDKASIYQITSLLQGVINRSSVRSIHKKGMAGKTGTTNDSKDLWFIGFNPHMTVGVYIGHDTPISMGKHSWGANVAFPFFIDFMHRHYKHSIPKIDFNVPDSIHLLPIDYYSGLLKNQYDNDFSHVIIEALKPQQAKQIFMNQPGYFIPGEDIFYY